MRLVLEKPDLPTLDPHLLSLDEWESGVEDYQGLNEEQICALLGIQGPGAIPFFNEWIDPNGGDPWLNKSLADSSVDNQQRQPLRAQWHQLVGILKMLKQAFEGKPTLLMDAVGLGKTLQVVGVIAMLAYYRITKSKTQDFPGCFGMSNCGMNAKYHMANFRAIAGKSYQGLENIPDLPYLLVVPLPLRSQVEVELHRYLKHGTFDVFVYDGGARRNTTFWDEVYKMSRLSEGFRIVLTSMKVGSLPSPVKYKYA